MIRKDSYYYEVTKPRLQLASAIFVGVLAVGGMIHGVKAGWSGVEAVTNQPTMESPANIVDTQTHNVAEMFSEAATTSEFALLSLAGVYAGRKISKS